MKTHWKGKCYVSGMILLVLMILVTGCNEQSVGVNDQALPSLERPSIVIVGNYTNGATYNPDQVDDPEKLAQRYEQVIEGMEDSVQKYRYMEQLIEFYEYIGQREKAISYLEQILDEGGAFFDPHKAHKRLARIYYESRQFEQALEMIQLVVSNPDVEYTNSEMPVLRGDIYAGLGDYEQARAIYQEAMELTQERLGQTYFDPMEIDHRLEALAKFQKGRDVAIQGRVTREGQGLAGLRVGVSLWRHRSYYAPQFIEITDKEGRYSFANLPEGEWNVFVELPRHRLDDYFVQMRQNGMELRDQAGQIRPGENQFDFTLVEPVELTGPENGTQVQNDPVTFTWEIYPGAAYYQFRIDTFSRDDHGHIWSLASLMETETKVESNQVVYDLAQLKEISAHLGHSSHSLSANQILGLHYPGAEVSWRVKAYDASGRLLSSSHSQSQPLNQSPYLVIDSGELERGDQELMDHEYFKALEIYLAEYRTHSRQSTATKIRNMITGMVEMNRWDYHDQFDGESYLELTRQAAKLLPEYAILNVLAELYYGEERYAEARKEFHQMLDLEPKSTSVVYKALAVLEIRLGDYVVAEKYLLEANLIGYKIAYQLLSGREMEISTDYQRLVSRLTGIMERLDQSQLQTFRQAMRGNRQEVVEEMLEGETITARYLNLLWRLSTLYREHFDDFELRQELAEDSQQLIEQMTLTEEEEQAMRKFVHFWL